MKPSKKGGAPITITDTMFIQYYNNSLYNIRRARDKRSRTIQDIQAKYQLFRTHSTALFDRYFTNRTFPQFRLTYTNDGKIHINKNMLSSTSRVIRNNENILTRNTLANFIVTEYKLTDRTLSYLKNPSLLSHTLPVRRNARTIPI